VTTNFDTDNIFYVPQQNQLRLFDLYGWRRVDLDVHRLNIFLNEPYLSRITEKLLEISDRCNVDKNIVAGFLAQIPVHHVQRSDAPVLLDVLEPQRLTFWARISDVPQESFALEDYELGDPKHVESFAIPLYGSFFFSSLQNYELNLPFEEGNEAFLLEIPRDDALAVNSLSAQDFLPILDEFCGYYGYSNRGNLVNYTMTGEIARDCLGCLPLFRIGDDLFATLYFHINTPVEHSLTISVPEDKIDAVLVPLKKMGFAICTERSGNWILSRGNDVIHYYANAAGKESLGSRFLAPFILVASADGNREPAARASLRNDIDAHVSLGRTASCGKAKKP
jgi:hypothetical protein